MRQRRQFIDSRDDNVASSGASRVDDAFSLSLLHFSSTMSTCSLSRLAESFSWRRRSVKEILPDGVPLHRLSSLIDLIRLISRLIGKESDGRHLALGTILLSLFGPSHPLSHSYNRSFERDMAITVRHFEREQSFCVHARRKR